MAHYKNIDPNPVKRRQQVFVPIGASAISTITASVVMAYTSELPIGTIVGMIQKNI